MKVRIKYNLHENKGFFHSNLLSEESLLSTYCISNYRKKGEKLMFTKGEYIVYEQKGVCRIEGFEAPDIPGIAKDRTYYVLLPVLQGGKLYVPADSAESKMRKIISRQEAEELIARLDQIDPLKASDDKTAEELYKSCMRSYDYTEWIRLIKCIYQHKQNRIKNGKNVTSRDQKYMRMAEEALYSELSIALDIPREQILSYILSKEHVQK